MSKWIFISDVHVKQRGDESDKILNSFLQKARNVEVSKVFLLGDIFDLMIGGYQDYLNKHQNYFEQLRALLTTKEVYIFEGNHDFHNKELYRNFGASLDEETQKNLKFYTEDTIVNHEGIRFYIGHGDGIEIDNPSYQIYKKIISSRFCYNLSQEIFNFNLVSLIGETASARSRKRNKDRYNNTDGEDAIKKRFRKSAEIVYEQFKVDFIICGHSHIKDSYQLNDECIYLNNGYAPRSLTYLEVSESGAWSFKEIF